MSTEPSTNTRLVSPGDPITVEAPPLDSKESRTAMNKILNAVEDLSDDQRARVLRAAAILYGIKFS